MTAKRTRLSKFEFAVIFREQNGLCKCGCGLSLEGGQIDEEHTRPIGLLGDPKPDSLWRRECHKRKTKDDIARISKAERQGLRTGQQARRARNGPKMKSRKTVWPKRKFRSKKDQSNDRE